MIVMMIVVFIARIVVIVLASRIVVHNASVWCGDCV